MTDEQARMWHLERARSIEAKIIKARTLDELQALEKATRHELDDRLRRIMQARAQVLRAIPRKRA